VPISVAPPNRGAFLLLKFQKQKLDTPITNGSLVTDQPLKVFMKKSLRVLLIALAYYGIARVGLVITLAISNTPGFFAGLFEGMLSIFHAVARTVVGGKAMMMYPNTRFYDIGFFIGLLILVLFFTSKYGDDDEGGENNEPIIPDPPGGEQLKKPRRRKRKVVQVGGRLRQFDFDINRN
jgi:hypothetical protein